MRMPITTKPDTNSTVESPSFLNNKKIEKDKKNHSFEDLKFNEKNKTMKDFMDSISLYFDSKLYNLGLTKVQQDNIKLVLY